MAEAPNTQTPFDPGALNGPSARRKRDVPGGLWMRCDGCEEMLYTKLVVEALNVCPKCGYHFRIPARRRIELLADADSFEELYAEVRPDDPLGFRWGERNYRDYVVDYQRRAETSEAVLTGIAYVKGRRVALGVMDNRFIMGSMGCVVGERLSRLIEAATAQSLPLVIVCTSGGARMHEGALSLMQMAKTSAALARFDDAGGLYIPVLTDPTTGGTTASFVMLGDVIVAEPGAQIGFAGQRVIANTIRQELPEGFQTAEFLLEHGFVDRIVPRSELRSEIARLIDYCG